MRSIYEQALSNPHLTFIDGHTSEEISLEQVADFLPNNNRKQLIFAYLDNSAKSVLTLYLMFKTQHAIALLPPDMSMEKKVQLELLYQPKWIIDGTRPMIKEYRISFSNEIMYYENTRENYYPIHDEIRLLLSTSGSTGSPKLIKITEENLISNAKSISSYLPLCYEDVAPLNLPIYYSYGLSILISNSIYGGRIICSNVSVVLRKFWEMFQYYGFTSIAGVPFVYELLNKIGFTLFKLPTLKYYTQAGGKLVDSLILKFGKYAMGNNKLFFIMYGQTEATARMSYLPPEYSIKKLGSIGKPILDGQFILTGDNSELCYIGPNVFKGYSNGFSDLFQIENIGILHTGDLARVDSEGFYYLMGRVNRFIKISGKRINLDEVELELSNHFQKNFKCVGLNDKYIICYVVGDIIEGKELERNISKFLNVHFTKIIVKKIPSIPMTSNNKVDYNKLNSIYEL